MNWLWYAKKRVVGMIVIFWISLLAVVFISVNVLFMVCSRTFMNSLRANFPERHPERDLWIALVILMFLLFTCYRAVTA